MELPKGVVRIGEKTEDGRVVRVSGGRRRRARRIERCCTLTA